MGDPIYTASNVACTMLSGLDTTNPLISIEAHLACAKKALTEQFFFVGITEKTNDSIELLYSRLGWKSPEDIPHFNAICATEDFSLEIDGITARNWADCALYEYALSLYESQKCSISPPLKQFSEEAVEYVSHYTYTFDQVLQGGYGWGIREAIESIPYICRWVTENNEAAIDCYLQSNQDYILQCLLLIQPTFYHQLVLSVNDAILEMQIIPNTAIQMQGSYQQFAWVHCHAVVPSSVLKKNEKTRIMFKMTPPKDAVLYQAYMQEAGHQLIYDNYLKGKFACGMVSLDGISF